MSFETLSLSCGWKSQNVSVRGLKVYFKPDALHLSGRPAPATAMFQDANQLHVISLSRRPFSRSPTRDSAQVKPAAGAKINSLISHFDASKQCQVTSLRSLFSSAGSVKPLEEKTLQRMGLQGCFPCSGTYLVTCPPTVVFYLHWGSCCEPWCVQERMDKPPPKAWCKNS